MGELDFSFRISELAFIRFFFLGILLFVLFRVLERVTRKSEMRSTYRAWFRRVIPPIEGITWFVFFLMGLNRLTSASFWSSFTILLVCLVAVIWVSWYAIRDIIAGIIIKTEGAISVNDRIQLKEITGQIIRMGYRIMEMETDTGETVNVPYSRVSGEMQIKSNPGEKMKSHRFELALAADSKLPINDILNQVKKVVYNAPWSSLKKAPQVKLLREEKGHKYIEVIIYALKVEYFSLIKNYLTAYLPEVSIK